MLKGDIIKGYAVLKDFTTAGGGLSKWTFAQKNGKEYFMKEFLSPKFPTKNAPGSPKSKARKLKICEKFEAHHQSLIKEINAKCGEGGNLVFTVDFFRNETKYYKITEKVDVASLSIQEIATLPLPKKILILKTIAHSLNVLHKAEVVHGDLKPDNVLIKQTKTGNYTAKLIDFDNSYFSGNPPEFSEDLVGDMVFYSPELAWYIREDTRVKGKDLTTLSDIFALGLLFYQYLMGSLPDFDQSKYHYACAAVQAGETLGMPKTDLPEELLELIREMWQLDYKKRPNVESVFQRLKTLDLKDYISTDTEKREIDKNPLGLSLKGGLKTKSTLSKITPPPKKDEPSTDSPKLRGKGLGIGKK